MQRKRILRKRDVCNNRTSAYVTTRRQFLRDTTLAGAGLSLHACFPSVGGEWAPKTELIERLECHPDSDAPPVDGAPVVAEVLDPASVGGENGNEIQLVAVEAMVEDGLKALTGDAAEPWRVILPDFAQTMRVGFKVNCLNEYCPTSVPFIKALSTSLMRELGLDGEQIIVWDRRLDELTQCGYDANDLGVQVVGTVTSTSDSRGPGYEDTYCNIVGGFQTKLSRIFTELTDVTINCPVLKRHGESGVTAGMKNVYGIIDNPWDFHRDLMTALPDIYALLPVRSRIRFTAVDALLAVSIGGTSAPSDAQPKRIFMSTDPVATDQRALDLLNEIRAAFDAELEARRAAGEDVSANNLGPIDSTITSWLGNAFDRGLGALTYDHVMVNRTE